MVAVCFVKEVGVCAASDISHPTSFEREVESSADVGPVIFTGGLTVRCR